MKIICAHWFSVTFSNTKFYFLIQNSHFIHLRGGNLERWLTGLMWKNGLEGTRDRVNSTFTLSLNVGLPSLEAVWYFVTQSRCAFLHIYSSYTPGPQQRALYCVPAQSCCYVSVHRGEPFSTVILYCRLHTNAPLVCVTKRWMLEPHAQRSESNEQLGDFMLPGSPHALHENPIMIKSQ